MSITPTRTCFDQARTSNQKQSLDPGQAAIGLTKLPVQKRAGTLQPVPRRTILPRRKLPIQNRVSVLLVHIPIFSIRGQARLAQDVGVSRSTISRLVSSRINPSYRLTRAVTDALERRLGRSLDMRDVFSTDGTYLTASGCGLCHCNGCLPEAAYDPEGNRRPEWRGQCPGDWYFTHPAGPSACPATSADAGHEGVADAGYEGVADAGKEAQ